MVSNNLTMSRKSVTVVVRQFIVDFMSLLTLPLESKLRNMISKLVLYTFIIEQVIFINNFGIIGE